MKKDFISKWETKVQFNKCMKNIIFHYVYSVVSKIEKFKTTISKETEEMFIVKLKELENMIEKHTIGTFNYMGKKAEIMSSLNNIVYISYNENDYYYFSDFLQNLDLYLDYTELYLEIGKKLIPFNDMISKTKSYDLIEIMNKI